MNINKCLFIFSIILLCALSVHACSPNSGTMSKSAGDLQISITDNTDNPLWGTKIVSEEQPEGQIKVTAVTGDSGVVTFNNIATGEYKFYVSRFDYFPIEIWLTVLEGRINEMNVRMTVENGMTTSITTSPLHVSFADLNSNPESYNGKYVAIEGYWFDGFEIAVLAERLEASGFSEGNVKPAGILIWATGGLSEEISSKLYLQENNASGYHAHYGKVELAGTLEYGEEYGHLNSYLYQFTIYECRWIDWTP